MHALTINNGTRVREMFYRDFEDMINEQEYMFDNYTYDLLCKYNMKTVLYSTFYVDEDRPDIYCDYVTFMDSVLDQINIDGIAIVLQHSKKYPDIVFIIASDN